MGCTTVWFIMSSTCNVYCYYCILQQTDNYLGRERREGEEEGEVIMEKE